MGAKSLFPNLDDYLGLSYTARNHIPILPLSTRELLDAAEKFVKRIDKNKPIWLKNDDLLFQNHPATPLPNFHATGKFSEYPSNRDVEFINHPPYEVINRRQVKYRPRTFYDAWDVQNEVDFFYAPGYRSIQASFPEPIKFYSNEFKPFFDACRPDPRFFFPPGSDVEQQQDRLVNFYFKSKDRYKPYLKDITLSFNLIGKIKKLSQPPDYLLFGMHHCGLHIPGFLDCYQTESGKYLLYNGYFNFSFPIIGEGKYPKWTIEERLVYLYLCIRTFHELEWKINRSGSQGEQFSLPQFEINEKRSKEMDGFGRAVLSRMGFHPYYHFSVTSGALRLSLFNEREYSFIKRFKDCIFVQDNELFEADRTELYINLDYVEYTTTPGKKVLSVRDPPNLRPPPAEIPSDFTKMPVLFGSCLTPDASNHHSHTPEEDIETAESAAAAMLSGPFTHMNNEGLIPEDQNVTIAMTPVQSESYYRTPTKFLYKGFPMQDNMVVDRGPYKNISIGRRIQQQSAVTRGSYKIVDPNTRMVTPPPRLLAESQPSYRAVPAAGHGAYRISTPVRPVPAGTPSRQIPAPANRNQQLFKTFAVPICNRMDPINLPSSSAPPIQFKHPLKRVEYGGISKPKYVATEPSTQTFITVRQVDKRIQMPKAPDGRFYVQKAGDPLTKTALRMHRNSAAVLVAQGSLAGRVTRVTQIPANVTPRKVTVVPSSSIASAPSQENVSPSSVIFSSRTATPTTVRAAEAAPGVFDISAEDVVGDAADDVKVPAVASKVLASTSASQVKRNARGGISDRDPLSEMNQLLDLFDLSDGPEQENNQPKEPQTITPKKKRGRPRNEDRLPEITAVEPLNEKERAERRKNNRTRTRFCNKVPEYNGLPAPTKVRDPENPKPPKIPLRVYFGNIRNNGQAPAKKRGRPRKTCYARGRNGAHMSKLLVALCQKRGNPILSQPTFDDTELEKLTAEAQSRNIVVTYGQPKDTKKRRPVSHSPFFFTQPKKRKPKADPKKPKEHKKKKKTSILMSGKQPRIRAPRYDSWEGLWPTSRLNALKEWLAEPIDFGSLDGWHLPPPTITDPHDPNELWNAAPVAFAKYAKDVLPAPDDYIWKDYDPIAEKYRREAEAEGARVDTDTHPESLVPEEGHDEIGETPEPVPSTAAEPEKVETVPQWELPPLEDYPETFATEEHLVDEKALDFTQPIAAHRVDVVFDPAEHIALPPEKPVEEKPAETTGKPEKRRRPAILTKALVHRLRHPKALPWPLLKWKHRFHQGKMLTRTEVIKRKEMVSAKADSVKSLKDMANIGNKIWARILKKEEYDIRHVRECVEALVRKVDRNVRISESAAKKKTKVAASKEVVEVLEKSVELEATPIDVLQDYLSVPQEEIQPVADQAEPLAVEIGPAVEVTFAKSDVSVSSLQSTEFVSAVQLTEHISKDVVVSERAESPLSIAVLDTTAEAVVDSAPPSEEVVSADDLFEKEDVSVVIEPETSISDEAAAPAIDVTMLVPETSTDRLPTVEEAPVDEELELVLKELVEKILTKPEISTAPEVLEPSLASTAIDEEAIDEIFELAEDIAAAAVSISLSDIPVVEEAETLAIPEPAADLAVLESEKIDRLEPTPNEELVKDDIVVADGLQIPIVEEDIAAASVPVTESEKVLDDLLPKELGSPVISELSEIRDTLVIDEAETPAAPEVVSPSVDALSKALEPASIAGTVPSIVEEDLSIVSELLAEIITTAVESLAVPDAAEAAARSGTYIEAVEPIEEVIAFEVKDTDITVAVEEVTTPAIEDTAQIEDLVGQLIVDVETRQESERAISPYNAGTVLAEAAVKLQLIPTDSYKETDAVSSEARALEDEAVLIEDREDRRTLKVVEDDTESIISAISTNAVATTVNEQNYPEPLLDTRKRRLFSDDTDRSDETTETPQRKRIFSGTDSSAPSSVRPLETLLEIEPELSEILEPISEEQPVQAGPSATASTASFDPTTTEDIDYDIKPRGPIRKSHADADVEDFFVTPPFKNEPTPSISIMQRYAPTGDKPSVPMAANIISNQGIEPESLYNRYKTHSVPNPMQRELYMRGIPPVAGPQPQSGYPQYPIQQQRITGDPARNPFYQRPRPQGFPTMVPYQSSQHGAGYPIRAHERLPGHMNDSWNQANALNQMHSLMYFPYEGIQGQYHNAAGPAFRPQQQPGPQQQPLPQQYNRPPYLPPGAPLQMAPNMPMAVAGSQMAMGSPAAPMMPSMMPSTSMLRMPPSTPMAPGTPMPMAPPATPMMAQPSTPIAGPTTPMAMGTPGTPMSASSVLSFASPATPAMPVPNIYADVRSRPTTAAGTPTEIAAMAVEPAPREAVSPQLSLETMRMIDQSIEEIRKEKNKTLRDTGLRISIDMAQLINGEVTPSKVTHGKRMTAGKPSHFKALPSSLKYYIGCEATDEQRLVLEKIRHLMAQAAMSLTNISNWENYGEIFSPELMLHAVANIYEALDYSGFHRLECSAWLMDTRKLRRALEMIYQELNGDLYTEEGNILKTIPSTHPSAAVRPNLIPVLCEQLKGELIAKQTIKMPTVHRLGQSNELYEQTSNHQMRSIRTLRDHIRLLLNSVPSDENIPEGSDRCVIIHAAIYCSENLTTGRGRKKKDTEREVGCHQFVVLSEKVQSETADANVIKVGPFAPIRLANADEMDITTLTSKSGIAQLDMSKRAFGMLYYSKLFPNQDQGQYANFICNQPSWICRIDQFSQPMVPAPQQMVAQVSLPALDTRPMDQQEPKLMLVEEPLIEDAQRKLETVTESSSIVAATEVTPILEERCVPMEVKEQLHPALGREDIDDDETLHAFEVDPVPVEEAEPMKPVMTQAAQQEAEESLLQDTEPILEEVPHPVQMPNDEAPLESMTIDANEPMLEEQSVEDLLLETESAVVEQTKPAVETVTASVVEEELVATLGKVYAYREETCIDLESLQVMQQQPVPLSEPVSEVEAKHVAEEEMLREAEMVQETTPAVVVQQHVEQQKESTPFSVSVAEQEAEHVEEPVSSEIAALVTEELLNLNEEPEPESEAVPDPIQTEEPEHVAAEEPQQESEIAIETVHEVIEQDNEELDREDAPLPESLPAPVTEQAEEPVAEEEMPEEPKNIVEVAQRVAEEEQEPEPATASEAIMEEESEQMEETLTMVEQPLAMEEDDMNKSAVVIKQPEAFDAREVIPMVNALIAPGAMIPFKPANLSLASLKFDQSDVDSLLKMVVPHPTLNIIGATEYRVRMMCSMSAEEQQFQDLKEKQILETVHQIRISFGKCKTHYLQLENHLRPSLSMLHTPLRDISTAQNFFSSSWKYHTLFGIADCAKKLCTPDRIGNWISQKVSTEVMNALEQIHKFTQQNFTITEIDTYLGFARGRIESMKSDKCTDEMVAAVSMEAAYAIMCKLFISPDILKRAEKLFPWQTTREKYQVIKDHTPLWSSRHTEAAQAVNNLNISISVNLNDDDRILCDMTMEEKAGILAHNIADRDANLAAYIKKMILDNAKEMKPYIRQTCQEAPLRDVPQCVRDASLYLLIQDQMTSIQDSASRVILQSIEKMNQFYETVKNKQEISHVPREQLVFDFEPASYGPKIVRYEPNLDFPGPSISRRDDNPDDTTDRNSAENDEEERRGEKRRAPSDSSPSGAGEPQSKMQNTSSGNGFWGAHNIHTYQPSLPSIREWDAESTVSRDSGVGSSCPSILSKTPLKRKYSGVEEKGMKMSKSTSVLECGGSTTISADIRASVEAALRLAAVEPTPSLLKYLATPLATSPRSTTSSEGRDSSQPPMKRPTPSTSTRPTPLATPNSTTMNPLSVIIPSERRHSQMFDTLLDVATREYRDSRSGSEDVEILDLSTKKNPPQSPLVSNRPTPLATPTTASTETTLLIPNTKEIERKRMQLLQQQQEEYEQQNMRKEQEMQQLLEIQELEAGLYELHQPVQNGLSPPRQYQQKQQKQPAMSKTVMEARPEKRPIKVLTVLDLPPIDQEELESNTVLPKKPNTFEFHFFNRNRYTVEKNWCERKVILGKSLRAGRGKRAHCPPTAEAKQVHKMYLAGKTELKLILKGAKLDFYEMEKQWDLDHPANGQQAVSPTTQPGPSTDIFALPKDFRPISPPVASHQCSSLAVKRVDAILATPEIIQQRVAEKSPIQLIERPRIITKAALKELPPPRFVQAPPCAAPVVHEKVEVVEDVPEVTEQEQDDLFNEEINVVDDEEPEVTEQESELVEEQEEDATIEVEHFEEEPSVIEEEPSMVEEEPSMIEEEPYEEESPIEVQNFEEEDGMVEEECDVVDEENFERESTVVEEEYLEEEPAVTEEDYSEVGSTTMEEGSIMYEEDDVMVEEEPQVYDEAQSQVYDETESQIYDETESQIYDEEQLPYEEDDTMAEEDPSAYDEEEQEEYEETDEEPEVIELTDSEVEDDEDDDVTIASCSTDSVQEITVDSPDFIDVIGTPCQSASPNNVIKERLIFDEDQEDSDEESAVDARDNADEGVEVDIEFDEDEDQELGRLVIDETSPVSTPQPEASLAHLSTALTKMKVQLNDERKKTPEAEEIQEHMPLVDDEPTAVPEPDPELRRYTSFYVEDLLRDKYTKRLETRRKEVCHFKQLPKIPLQPGYVDHCMDRLRRTAFTAEYEKKRMMEMSNCEHAFKHLYEGSEWREFIRNYPIRRARSVDSFFGRNVEEHFGEHWEFAEQRMFLEDLNLYPLVTQNILGTVLSRCNSPATIAPCHQDDTPEERAFEYRQKPAYIGDNFYNSSEGFDREHKLVFSDVDSDISPPPTEYDGSLQPRGSAESSWEDSTELRPSDENSAVSSIEDRLESDENSVVSSSDDRHETRSQYDYESSVSSRNDLETRSV